MSAKKIKAPILLLVFNRLDCTKLVLEKIREAQPEKLYIVSDGPRPAVCDDAAKVQLVRDFLDEAVTWPCEVKKIYRDRNLGCKYSPSEGITWFFENEEMGIILEDDCVPSNSFFEFCDLLLDKYKDDTRIWHIDGTNFNDDIRLEASYAFSKYPLIWGWASWRRAWLHYDVEMKSYKNFKKNKLIKTIWKDKLSQRYWSGRFDEVLKGLDAWDYQWFYCIWVNHGLTIRPAKNLIKNVGFSGDATHTKTLSPTYERMALEEIDLNLVHPMFVISNESLDRECGRVRFNLRPLAERLYRKLFKILRGLVHA